ncbi:MAG: 50S ribosomal protein L17 [Victivallales bacterium]|nr:50S ribosomal protein L17 [Victivallales bacterium]
MRHRQHTFKIGRSGAHRKALLANQVSSLIDQGEIKTTLAKAKESRRLAEKMVTMAKKGDLHHRRIAISKLRDKLAVAKLFSEIAPRYSSRDGGYTRIIKLGRRVGDAAELCILQWVEETKAKRKTNKKVKKVSEADAEAVPSQDDNAEKAVEESAEKKNDAETNKAPEKSSEKNDAADAKSEKSEK